MGLPRVGVVATSVGALAAVGLAVSYPLFWLARSAGLSGDEGAIRAGTITWVIVAAAATVLLLWFGVPMTLASRSVQASSGGSVALWRRPDGATAASMSTPGYQSGRDDVTTAIWLTLLRARWPS